MATNLEEIMARASKEVAAWPDWKRSADIKAELQKIEQAASAHGGGSSGSSQKEGAGESTSKTAVTR